MIPTEEQIKKEIRRLQKAQELKEDDVIASRMLYTVSEILRWATQSTTGWERPLENVLSNVEILKKDLGFAKVEEGESNV